MRQLTAETRIRVRAPLPLPHKRELTGETRIRLSQIKDLKDWALEMAQDEAAPEGTVHHWSDGDHIKKNGKWVPIEKNSKKQEKPTERQLATRYSSNTEKSNFSKYLTKLYGEGHACLSLRSFIKESKAQVYTKEKPVITKNGTDIAPLITEGLSKLKEITGEEFKKVLVLDDPTALGTNTIAAVFSHEPFNNVLLINKESDYWTNEQTRNNTIAISSTKLPEHVFIHEMGHNKVAELSNEWDNEDDKTIASHLSNIAARTPDEFQSELYARKHAGMEIDEELIELYERYGGSYENI